MNKEDYIKIIKRDFKGDAQNALLQQVENFYKLEPLKLKNERYKVGDFVKLKKNTFLHGIRRETSLAVFDIIAENGLINKDFENGAGKHKVHHAVSLWQIRKDIKLKDYIPLYSGMEVEIDDGNSYKLVPYGKLDAFIEEMKKYPHWKWTAENTMETRFMPSLAGNRNHFAFILNGRDKVCKDLISYNLNEESMPLPLAKKFLNFNSKEREKMWEEKRRRGPDERIGYILFGLPKNMIEGVFVGRQFEKNQKILKHIKEKLPDCYICNLDGKVIVE